VFGFSKELKQKVRNDECTKHPIASGGQLL